MSDKDAFGATFWARGLEEVDREIARLATICNCRILDPGIIERVLKDDASVCGSSNPLAFKKLRETLMMHYNLRDRAVATLGEEKTARLVQDIVDNLRQRIGERLGTPPSE